MAALSCCASIGAHIRAQHSIQPKKRRVDLIIRLLFLLIDSLFSRDRKRGTPNPRAKALSRTQCDCASKAPPQRREAVKKGVIQIYCSVAPTSCSVYLRSFIPLNTVTANKAPSCSNIVTPVTLL